MQQRISIITLGVSNLAKSRAFYIKGLGWKEANSSNKHISFFQMNGLAFALYSKKALAEDVGINSEITTTNYSFTLAYNTHSKEEVDNTLEFAAKADATILKPAQEVFWGGYSGYFADPDGFLWEVAYNPFITIAEDGACILP